MKMVEEGVCLLEKGSWLTDMKQKFDDELSRIRVNAARNSVFLTETSYHKLVDDVERVKTTSKREPRDYWLLNRYDVMIVENKSKLIYPIREGVGSIRYYVTDSELFDVLHETHLAIGHGGRDRMLKELSTKYKNVTRHDIELYLQLCEPCQKKLKGVKKVPPANSVQAQQQSTPHSSPQPQPSPPPAFSQKKSNLPPLAPKPAPGPKQPQSSPGPSSSIKQLPKLLPKPQGPPEVCLRWNSYHSNMQNTFPSLLNNEQFVDVTLACDGRSIKCHKVMLSACSPYMEELLSSNPCQHPIIFLKDMKFWQLQALIDFMYRGEVNVTQDKLPSLLSAAEALQIKGLASPVNHSAPPKINQIQTMPTTQHDFPEEMDQVTYMRHLQLQTDIKNEYDEEYIQDTDESPPPTPKAKKRKTSHTVSHSSGNSNGTGGGGSSGNSATHQTKSVVVNKSRREKDRFSEPSTSHQISNTTAQVLPNQNTSTASGMEHRRKSDGDKVGTGMDSENEFKSFSENIRHSTQDDDLDLTEENAEAMLGRYSSQNDVFPKESDGNGDGGGGDGDDNHSTASG